MGSNKLGVISDIYSKLELMLKFITNQEKVQTILFET